MATGQATRPAGADTNRGASPSHTGAATPTTSPASIGQKGDANATTAATETQPIRRDKDAPAGSGNGGNSAARRDGSGKPVAPPQPPASGFAMRNVALSLGAVLGLIFLLYWLIKQIFPGVAAARSSQAVRVLTRSVLSPKQQVLLLQVGKRLIVVGDSGAQMNALAQIEDPDEIAALVGQLEREKRPAASAFGGFFRRAKQSFEEPEPESPRSLDGPQDEEEPPPELGLTTARSELKGLMDRVQELSQTFRKS